MRIPLTGRGAETQNRPARRPCRRPAAVPRSPSRRRPIRTIRIISRPPRRFDQLRRHGGCRWHVVGYAHGSDTLDGGLTKHIYPDVGHRRCPTRPLVQRKTCRQCLAIRASPTAEEAVARMSGFIATVSDVTRYAHGQAPVMTDIDRRNAGSGLKLVNDSVAINMASWLTTSTYGLHASACVRAVRRKHQWYT